MGTSTIIAKVIRGRSNLARPTLLSAWLIVDPEEIGHTLSLYDDYGQFQVPHIGGVVARLSCLKLTV